MKQQFVEHYFNISTIDRLILRYLANGYTDKEIADDLRIAPGTVRNHVFAIKRQAGLRTRPHLIAYAVTNGIVETSPGSMIALFKS